jgi:hypothetical protein
MAQRSRLAHIAVREASFLSLSILGAILFLNHQILYMTGEKPSALSWTAYVASTVVIYGFVRGIFFAGEMRVPRAGEDPSVCPECGQPLADGTPFVTRMAPRETPHEAHSRPAVGVPQVRLLRPIVSSAPPLPVGEDVVNPSLESILQRLTENPPTRFVNSGPSGSGGIPAPPPPEDSKGPPP